MDVPNIEWRHTIQGKQLTTQGFTDCAEDLDTAAVPLDLSQKAVLDIGCSDGGHSFLCEQRGATVTGIDSQESPRNAGRNGFAYAREQLGMRASYEAISLKEFAKKTTTTFDHVLCFNVLYHVTDVVGFVDSIRGLMKPGATLHLKTAVSSSLPSRVQQFLPTRWSLWRRPRFEFADSDHHGDSTCWWFPSPSGVVSLLERAGFESVVVRDRKIDRLFVTATAAHELHPNSS